MLDGGHTFMNLHFLVGEECGDVELPLVRAVSGGGWGSRFVREATSGRAYGACGRPAVGISIAH